MALGEASDFLVVDRLGQEHNLEEYFYPAPFFIAEVSI
jgi:ureidoglycolate lyase